ncbi:tetratricopeptide repeat protein [Bacillus sp. KH172YL63]|uniref:tetratricopeptide repeat protein n=1 Tax=Bacillus sp. KH172YL63 TaxID=2709784 RepID=UPI0013E4CA54|nr:tetratricopeptide repeat protein [Bacillus sp. KH172YL63]BCB05626.1 TPR repeat-containing protein YvcD [Bacillus sp. KH172YL63]
MRKGSNLGSEQAKVLSFVPTGEYYYNKGMKAYQRRELKKSLKYLNRAFQLEPVEPMIACQLSIVYTELGEYKRSNDLLHNILDELDPHMSECHYFLANNYAHLGLFKEAYEQVSAYLDKEEYGEFVEDAEDLLELLELDSDLILDDLYEHDDLIVQQEKARDLLESGHFQKAVEALQQVIKDYPEFWSAYNNLALAYFYLGEVKKASATLEEVLGKNPGNLHALCNTAVFYFYQDQKDELAQLVQGLEKVRPLLHEHRYKLGATFALIGHSEKAYEWLKFLQKVGFEGDGSFYYWLSYSAHDTGHADTARSAWKKVLEINPEKEGLEPWNDKKKAEGFENHVTSILKKLQSDYTEEKLFGLFLTSVSNQQRAILTHADFCDVGDLSVVEKLYLAEVLNQNGDTQENNEIHNMHQVALHLYSKHKPVSSVESGLFLTWFTIAYRGMKEREAFKNTKAFAAATEYVWKRLRNEKVTKKQLCDRFEVSQSTLTKYVDIVESYLP